MNLLILNWGAYTQPDINDTLRRMHVSYKVVSYCFKDKNEDSFFSRRFLSYLTAEHFDAVFSVNFFPLAARVCQEAHVKYLSWSYDNPLNVPRMEETLGFDTNFVFLFDRIQTEYYQARGFRHIFHLPLSVNPDRLAQISLSSEDIARYQTDIAFLGKLYPSKLPLLLSSLKDKDRGYLDALMEMQFHLYGCYLLDELLSSAVMGSIREQVPELSMEQLSYAMASEITRRERLTLLTLLSNKHQVSLYSPEDHSVLDNVRYMGTAGYLDEMPKIFAASRINLNITLKILQSGMPLRTLDIMGCGGFLLSNYQPELSEYFIPDREFVMYTDLEDAIDKADYYLMHEEARSKIACAGQTKSFRDFSYEHQLTALFRAAGLS